MDSRNTPMGNGDGVADWNDMSMFTMPAESPFGSSAFNDFTNLDAYGETPDAAANAGAGPNAQAAQPPLLASTSAESSSQDSASDTSSRRKRKTESESPISNPTTESGKVQVKMEDVKMNMGDVQQVRSYDHFSQPMHNLSLEQRKSYGDGSMGQFDFNSAASSPIQAGDFNSAMSLDAQVHMPAASMAGVTQFQQDSPVQTINPGMFAIAGSRDQSPATNLMFNQASPNAIFSTPSSDSPETFSSAQWNASLAQSNPQWPSEFQGQLTSPGGINLTPSPVPNGGTPSGAPRGVARRGRSALHIAPISTKSRVETQINIVMTLEKLPPAIEHLHLPLHTIAKSKLLAKEDFDKSKVLELHTMLVCTSAMHNPQFKEKALQKAAAQNNDEIQRRAELMRDSNDEDKNDSKNLDDADKPANGGEVRICSNCIQRERKRAGRKKTKREEEQQHWERFETERVVVFNSNEYLPFKPCEPGTYPQRDTGVDGEQYIPPDGALHVTAAMRIACYCRHQSEKEGFQVIFTMKDQQGNVVAQQISDSILITDDHKTHPQSFSATVPNEGFYQTPGFLPNGLQMSHSMVDMSAHVQPFTSSRSAGNLPALAYGAQFNPHSHVHQLPGSGYASQATSATMTPTSLSRPGSPTSAGQAGPNKKRKSSTFHRKVPSGLTMTPRVDTSQPPSSNMPSAISMNSQFSPTGVGFPNQMNQSYMTIPNNNGPAQYFGSGPPTPNENGPFNFSQPQVDVSRMQGNQAYFSHPSSAVPSRASSPVLQTRGANMAAYARQHPIQTPTNTVGTRQQQVFQAQPGSAGTDANQVQYPSITRITPNEGPVSGGTEVAIFGDNFVTGIQVQFGDQISPTQVISPNSMLTISPPGRAGSVHLTLLNPPGTPAYPMPASRPIFRYTQYNEEMMVMALKFLSEQQYGNTDTWQNFAQQSASSFIQSRVGRAGIGQPQGYPATHRSHTERSTVEDMILSIFDAADMSESPRLPDYDLISTSGNTMLTLACSLGFHRVVAALLARGANTDSRDRGGYSPLLHAAVQGHTKIFQLLIARGADSTIRSLCGYAALDLVPHGSREEYSQILLNTARRRNSRPTLRSCFSYDSTPSSQASWDIASASYYESEVGGSEQNCASRAPSRRASVQLSHKLEIPDPIAELPEPAGPPIPTHCFSAMVAWRNALAAQINHFQETVHNIHLPPLPRLPDYRKFSSLAPCKPAPDLDIFPASAPASASNDPAPPAYHDIYPDEAAKGCRNSSVKNQCSGYEEVGDVKCGTMFETGSAVSSVVTISPESAASHKPNKTDQATFPLPPWLGMALLVFLTSNIMDIVLPYVTTTSAETRNARNSTGSTS